MATQQLAQPASLTDQATQLLTLLGGTKSTSNPGDTGALQSTLGQLQGTDYEAMLQSIFNKAGGQIPGIQQALGNAIGARSGGNSAVQAALSKLLAQTSTGAMDQVAKLQSQNMQTQAQIGNSIAAATKGTTERKGVDTSGGLATAAKLVALLQGTKTLGLNDAVKNLFSPAAQPTDMAGFYTPSGSTGYVPSADAQQGAQVFTSMDPMFSADFSAPVASQYSGGQASPNYAPDYVPQNTDAGFQFTDMSGFQTPSAPVDYTPSFESAPVYEPADYFADTYTFADGGIVRGRGNATAQMEPSDTPAVETQEEEGEAKSNARYDAGFTANNFLDTFRKLLGANDNVGKAEGYADGGTVRAGGSRRSANPTIDPVAPTTALAQLSTDELRGQFGQQAQALSSPVATASSGDMVNSLASFGGLSSGGGSGGSGNGAASFGGTPGMSPGQVGSLAGKAGALSNVSGALGGPTLGPVGGVLGLAGGLANAKTNEQALGMIGQFGLNAAVPGLGALAGFAMNPSITGATDLGLSAAVPGYAVVAGLMDAFGVATPAQVVANAIALENPNQMMTPEQQMTVATEGANPNSASLTGQANAMEGDALGNLMGLTNSFGTGGGSGNGGFGGMGDRGPGGSSGDSGASAGGAGPGGPGGYRNGGPVSGPGTGISDSIHNVSLSDGEFVISADVVSTLGEDFFNQLQAAFHTPAAQQRAQ